MNRMAVPPAAIRRSAPNSRSTSGPGSDAVASSSTSSGKRPASPAPSRARATPTAVRSDSASWPISADGSMSYPRASSAARRGGAILGAAQQRQRAQAAVHPEVVRDRHRLDETQVLVDEAEPGVEGGRRRPERERDTGDLGDGARIRLVVAGEDLDDRGLAGSVLADEGVDLPDADVQVDVVEGPLSREGLAQPDDAQRGMIGCARAHGGHLGANPTPCRRQSNVIRSCTLPPSPSPFPGPWHLVASTTLSASRTLVSVFIMMFVVNCSS